MKIFMILFFASVALSITPPQKKQYVCAPCGYACDKEVHDEPGTCHACGMALVEKSTIKFSDVTFEQLCARLKANPKAILLDVRSPGEFTGTTADVPTFGHFKNAININVEELEARVTELSKYKNQEVLVYCSHSHRSPRASYFLSTHGFTNVKNVAAGVSVLPTSPAGDCLGNWFVRHRN
jgi:rhodanese-related sulfurtransferase